MAGRLRLIPVAHLVVGVAMTLLVIVSRPGQGDPSVFAPIAEGAAHGLMPYRDYPVEYPPLGFLAVVVPRLLGGPSLNAYNTIFSIISLAVTLGTLAAVYWLARRRWSVEAPLDVSLMFVGICLAGAPLVIWRFDILAALLTVLALVAFAANRPGWSGTLLGLGVLTKLYPVFLGPVFGLAQLFERRWRDFALLLAGSVLSVGVVMAGMFLVAGGGALSFLQYQQARGVEIESITGAVALLLHTLGLATASISFGFGSFEVSSSALDSVTTPSLFFEVALAIGLIASGLYSYARDVRETGAVRPLTIVQFTAATVLLVILTNKVLSPQYLVWVLPFVTLLSGRKSLLFLAAIVLTTLLYPLAIDALLNMRRDAVLLLNLRNALLVVLFVWIAWPQRHAPERQNEAMLETPPMTPASTPNTTSA